MGGEGECDREEAGVTSEAAALMPGMRNIGLCALALAVDHLSPPSSSHESHVAVDHLSPLM